MADDKKNIPEAAPPAEASAPAVESAVVSEQPAPEPALTDAETVMLEHEGQAALFEMGEAVPDPADAVTPAEVEEPAAPEVPKAEKEQEQPPDPGKDAPAPAHSGKVVDFAAARDEAAKEEKKAVKQKPPTEKDKAAKPGKGRPPKADKAAPDKAKPPKPRDKKSQSKPAPEKPAVDKGGAPAGTEVTPEPSAPRDATRAEKEEIVYLNLSDLHPFKNHPFGVRDDAEMQGLVESVKAAGVNQPALVRPREDGGYWIFFKWIFKTACAILILSNTFNIVMAVFDVSQSVIARAAGIVQGSTDISESMLADLEATLETLGLGSLLGLWLQSLLIHVTMWAINIVIFVIVYGRMIEIYLLTSLAPIPVATLSNRELGSTGQNYLKSLFAVGFQGLLILVCVAIYAVLIQGIATSGDPIGAIWGCMGYSVLLCFCLFKTGSIARSVFSAH